MKRISVFFIAIVFFLHTALPTLAAATAITVYQNTNTSAISRGYQAGGKVRFDLKTPIYSLQHSKFTNDTFTSASATHRANTGGKFTAFAYSCPGYYITRVYSDSNYSNMVGYIKTYVASSNFTKLALSKCEPISPPSSTNEGNLTQKISVKSVNPTADDPEPIAPIPPPTPQEPPTTPTECQGGKMINGLCSQGYWNMPGSQPMDLQYSADYTNPDNVIYYLEQDVMSPYCEGRIPLGSELMDIENIKSVETLSDGSGYGDICKVTGFLKSFDSGGSDGYDADGCPVGYKINTTTNMCESEQQIQRDEATCTQDTAYCYGTMDYEVRTDYTSKAESDAGCAACALFECPGFGDYMSDLTDMLDYAIGDVTPPDVPDLERPEMPNIFDVLNNVDERNPALPTGQEDPNLGNASFDENDVKNGADEIQFREDPTGGFNITNPIDSLPQDGSTAPRPGSLEVLEYPKSKTVETTQKEVKYPTSPGGTVTPPTTSGSVQQPGYQGTAEYPTP